MVTVDCSSMYSEDGFELSTSPVSSVFQAGHTSDEDSNNISGSNTTDERSFDDSTSDGRSQEQATRGEQIREKRNSEEKPTPPASSATEPDNRPSLSDNGDGDGGTGGEASPEPSAYSSFGSPARSDEGEHMLPIQSSFVLVTEQDSRTAKQKYVDLERKVAKVREKADSIAQCRREEDVQARLQSQETKESWETRIHRRHTETEWHQRLSEKTAQSIVDISLNREAWMNGISCSRVRDTAKDEAFSSKFHLLRARTSERGELAVTTVRKRAVEDAAACSTAWDAARHGVPVRRLRELMEKTLHKTRHNNPSEPFEQLCRRAEGIVVESKHPYPKGIQQDVEVCVAGAECFYVAFDAASNATAGAGKVSLRGVATSDAAVFKASGPYCNDPSCEERLPGVNGEPPMRVKGSSVLVTFSASYWRGIAPAGEDYGWRLVCFTAGGGTIDDAKALVAEAEKAADRAEAVDAFNILGETCLHVACFEGNAPAVRYLLSLDADPNSAHTAGGLNTPLHEAARGGSLAATLLLLKSSANVLAANAHGDLPLHVACRGGRMNLAKRLLAHDSDWSTVVAVNYAGQRPSDAVHGCAALVSLIEKIETTAGGKLLAGARSLAWRKSGGGRGYSSSARAGCRPPKEVSRRHGGRGVVGCGDGCLLSGGVLPRWTRLPRPLDRGISMDDTESRAGSGSSSMSTYGVSLAESDFQVAGTLVNGTIKCQTSKLRCQ